MRDLRVLALGAGVQSSALLLLSLAGEVEPLDAAIFADTGWEPARVYAHLWMLAGRAAEAGLPLYVVNEGDIRRVDALTSTGGTALDAPWRLRHPDGSEGMLRRQCTQKLKIQPIRRQIRALRAPGQRTEQWFGISTDEVQRMRDSDVSYVRNRYPLVELGWRRSNCIDYLAGLGIDAPRSACIGCPYHSDRDWRAMKRDAPAEFAQAAAWEREAQAVQLRGVDGRVVRSVPFIHRQLVPLDQVDLSTPEDHGQLTIDDECSGVCWT